MATDYVVIGHNLDEISYDGLNLTVVKYEPLVRTPVEVDEGTLAGDASMSFGASKNVWNFTALVAYSNPPEDYADLADVKAWFADNTATGNLFKFQSLEDATIYDVLLLNKAKFAPRPISATLFDAGSLYEVDIELIEQ